MDEVKKAVFQMGATKAPGPDGLCGQFYHHYWTDIQQDVFQMVDSFLTTGIFDPKLNVTHIVLIPKVATPEHITQYRPISLCNFSYKVISKVMANRLKLWLPEIIAIEQSAFVSGRQIQDNILIVQEVLHQLRIRKRKKKAQAVLKLDMQKAYDRVEWDFLCECMKKMGFCKEWVQCVKQCISTVSFSVKINGESMQQFHPSRDIRQGDPLSPYLFILMANVLSILMSRAVSDGSLRGIKLNRWCPTLSHLLFADDAIFFLDGTIMECQNLANILNQYCYASGQAINLNKSGIFFSQNCPLTLKRNLANQLRVPIIDKTGKYLGIPSDWGQSKKHMFAWILARVNSKLEGWKEKLLTKAGKEVLIKTVVQALPQYAMSIFKIPISICKAIEKRIACFWWKQTVDRKGIHWKSWESLRTRKDTGGLGFRDLVSFNKAMLGRQAWRLVQDPNSLWTKVVKGIYYPQGEFWRAGKGSRPSWGWQSLLIGRETIESETRWLVGDGKQIRIREDVWLPRGRIGGGANLNEPTTVAELIVPEEKEWDVAKLKEMFDEQVINEK